LRVYTDLNERDEIVAKIHLRKFQRKCTFKITKLSPDGRPLETELQVPNEFVEEAKSILKETKTSIVKDFDNGSVNEVGAAMDLLRKQGIEPVLITRHVDNLRSTHQSVVVLEEDELKAKATLKEIP
jgi:hypothetical protein